MQDQSAILEGSLWRSVPRFALPLTATSILEQLSSLIDVVMIGHFSGEGGELGMAAVGANTPIMSLGATAALIVAAALVVRPSRSFASAHRPGTARRPRRSPPGAGRRLQQAATLVPPLCRSPYTTSVHPIWPLSSGFMQKGPPHGFHGNHRRQRTARLSHEVGEARPGRPGL
nr:MATE family efflux transporter [Paratractidigestivibacter faecalis]